MVNSPKVLKTVFCRKTKHSINSLKTSIERALHCLQICICFVYKELLYQGQLLLFYFFIVEPFLNTWHWVNSLENKCRPESFLYFCWCYMPLRFRELLSFSVILQTNSCHFSKAYKEWLVIKSILQINKTNCDKKKRWS